MTREELAKHDGKNAPVYVAVSGVIYDVSSSPYWKGGIHEGLHHAGGDLTEELRQAPHVRAVIERFPVVGTLAEEKRHKGSKLSVYIGVTLIALGILAYLAIR